MAFPTVLDGRIIAKDCQTILEDHVHLMVQALSEGSAMYLHDNAQMHTPRLLSEWFEGSHQI